MELREFTKEDLVRAITRLLRSEICCDYASEYADMLESGEWLNPEVWEAIEFNERVEDIEVTYED